MAVNKKKNIAIIIAIIVAICVILAVTAVMLLKNNKENGTSDTDDTLVLTTDETANADTTDTETAEMTKTEEDTYVAEPLPTTSGEQEITKQTVTQTDTLPSGMSGNLKIEYPVVDGKDYGENVDKFNARITALVDEYKASYIAETQSSAASSAMPYDVNFEITYNVVKNKDGILSVLFMETCDAGGAHPNTVYKAVNFALTSGSEIPLSGQFSGSEEYKNAVAKLVYEKVKQTPEAYYEGLNEQTILDTFNENNYYFTDKGITVFFQPSDIAPHSAGIQEFEISYSDIADYIVF